jgi:L-seryl-tRNA(Ser) seleniumtransferase
MAEDPKAFLARYGPKRRINAAGPLTRLGGILMSDQVLDVMREAAHCSFDMPELQAKVGAAIAKHCAAEAAMVTTGASAGLTLGTAACLAGFSAARMDRLPDTSGMPNVVLMARPHRNGYDHAIRLAGAVIRDVGFDDRHAGSGIRSVEPWEYEAAIGPETVAIAYTVTMDNLSALPEVCAVAKKHGLPVIVDAAAQLPPAANLKRFTTMGVDLVVFSGGKAIGGPQATGILAGRRDLIASALLQQQDMDVNPLYWAPPASLATRDQVIGIPHHGLGRGFKAGREEIVGLLAALDAFVARDEVAWLASLNRRLETIAARIAAATPIETDLVDHGDGRAPELRLRFGGHNGLTAFSAAERLRGLDPAIHLAEEGMADGRLTIKLLAMPESDDAYLADSIVGLVSG